ncbi:hypothetical protein, partial [Enterobacter hormaechei]
FIIGVLRMMDGARGGGQRRRINGTNVLRGKLVATGVGLLLIPALLVVFQRLRQWGHGRKDSSPKAQSGSAPVSYKQITQPKIIAKCIYRLWAYH